MLITNQIDISIINHLYQWFYIIKSSVIWYLHKYYHSCGMILVTTLGHHVADIITWIQPFMDN